MRRIAPAVFLTVVLISPTLPGTTHAEECRTGNCMINAPDWITDSFRVTCGGSDRLFLKTYLTAQIVNATGWPDCRGSILMIKNNSYRYGALYNHLGTPPNMNIEPGEELRLSLPIYRAPGDMRTTEIELVVRYHP